MHAVFTNHTFFLKPCTDRHHHSDRCVYWNSEYTKHNTTQVEVVVLWHTTTTYILLKATQMAKFLLPGRRKLKVRCYIVKQSWFCSIFTIYTNIKKACVVDTYCGKHMPFLLSIKKSSSCLAVVGYTWLDTANFSSYLPYIIRFRFKLLIVLLLILSTAIHLQLKIFLGGVVGSASHWDLKKFTWQDYNWNLRKAHISAYILVA